MTKPVLINDWFDFSNAVPVKETTKEKWIEEAIQFLEDNADTPMTFISSGDTLILVHRDEDGTYEVKDLEIRKEASFKAGVRNPDACICDMQVVISQGCQCGGK